MCKRILNIRDNELYTYGEIGLRLNDYFIKNNINAKNKHYELHKFKDICTAEGLGPGKHKGYELLPVIQKEIERVKANQAKVKTAQPGKKKALAITPIEELAETTAQEFKKSEAVNAIVMDKADAMKTFVKDPEPKESELVKAYCKGFDTGAETVKAEPGDFVEIIRKKFYTDYHFFIKYARTPEERVAITNALGNLYGNIGGLSNG